MPNIYDDPGGVLGKILGVPVKITSAARSDEDNRRVRGSSTSEHLSRYGHAYDFDAKGLSEAQVAEKLEASDLPYDQVIREGNHVHIGFRPEGVRGRRQNLIKEGSSYVPAGATASPAVNQALGLPSPEKDPLYLRATKGLDREMAANKEAADAIKKNIEREQALSEQPVTALPPLPKMNDLPPAPDEQLHSDPMRVFGQMMPMLVAFGSLATRAGGIGALNSATAAMNAATAKDKDALERSHQEWKDHTDQALRQNQLESERYKEVTDRHDLEIKDKAALYQAIASDNQDRLVLAKLATGDFDGVAKLIDLRDKAAERLMVIRNTADEHDLRRKQLKIEQQRANFEQENGVSIDKRIYDAEIKSLGGPDKVTPDQQLEILKKISAAKSRGGKLTPPQAAAKFLDDFQQADPEDDTTRLDYDGLSAPPKEWSEAISAPIPTARQIELKTRFMQANKDSIKIAETAASTPGAAQAAPSAAHAPTRAQIDAAAPHSRPLFPGVKNAKVGWIYRNQNDATAWWDGTHLVPIE